MDVKKTNYDSVNKNYVYAAVGVVVLALIAWGIYDYTHQNGYMANTQQPATDQSSDNGAASTTPAMNPSGHTIKQYEAALVTYNNRRIQFLNCHAIPINMTLKNPATIMLDNRSTTTSNIMIDKKTYPVLGLDYLIVTINEPLLPVHSEVECNADQNVATLLIEK